jgi:hypothetical protein
MPRSKGSRWGANKQTRYKTVNKTPKNRAFSGKTKVVDGKTYELHPTKGWRKKGELK